MSDDLWLLPDHTVSRRFFRWPARQTDWWRLVLTGHEENCNRTIGIKIPFIGMIFVCVDIPLRQKPHHACINPPF